MLLGDKIFAGNVYIFTGYVKVVPSASSETSQYCEATISYRPTGKRQHLSEITEFYIITTILPYTIFG